MTDNDLRKLDSIKALLIDMDGVLYRGSQPVDGLPEFFDFLRRRSIKYMLTSNNSTNTPTEYSEKLRGMGVEIDPALILTSGVATARHLREKLGSSIRLYIIGEDSLKGEIVKANPDCVLTDDSPDAVVVALDFSLSYQKLKTACILIRSGVRFIATNPDTTLPAEDALYPGTGSIIAFLEACTGVKAEVVGKPNTVMFDLALKQLGIERENTAVLGDRLGTDILGGYRAGMATIMVLTGISSREDIKEVHPHLIYDSIAHLAEEWEKRILASSK